MPDLFDNRAVPLIDQLAAAKRELNMRREVYPRRVRSGAMTASLAERETHAMEAIVKTLQALVDGEKP